jgi:prophage tail gpP-like protein
MASDLRLIVNGRSYAGWKRVRVTRSIESLAGSFELDVSDRWAEQEVPWAIAEEDACRVEIDGEAVIDGFVDHRTLSIDSQSRRLGYRGRDRAAALVDCSAVLDKWTFNSASVLDIARALAKPFGITVSLQPGIVLPKPLAKLVVSPGDTAWAVIEKAAQAAGVLVVSSGTRGILITRAGEVRADAIVEGENLLAASVDYDGTARFGRYIVATQTAGTDEASGGATRIRAEATDEGVIRSERVLLVRPESGITTDYARTRADWEARIRAAKAETVSVTVLGWKQPTLGDLWPVNAIITVRAPSIGVDGKLLISQADYSLDNEGGEITQLRLVRPDAFDPEPRAVVRNSSGGRWKELDPDKRPSRTPMRPF